MISTSPQKRHTGLNTPVALLETGDVTLERVSLDLLGDASSGVG